MGYYMSDKLYDLFEHAPEDDLTPAQVKAVLRCLGLEDDPRVKYVQILVGGEERI